MISKLACLALIFSGVFSFAEGGHEATGGVLTRPEATPRPIAPVKKVPTPTAAPVASKITTTAPATVDVPSSPKIEAAAVEPEPEADKNIKRELQETVVKPLEQIRNAGSPTPQHLEAKAVGEQDAEPSPQDESSFFSLPR